jgi:hypothetical protein
MKKPTLEELRIADDEDDSTHAHTHTHAHTRTHTHSDTLADWQYSRIPNLNLSNVSG